MYQLFLKKDEDSDWDTAGKETTDRDFLENIARYEVEKDGKFSAQVVNVETDTTVYWI